MKTLRTKIAVTAAASTIISIGVLGANCTQAASLWEFNQPTGATEAVDSVGFNEGTYVGSTVNGNGTITTGPGKYVRVANSPTLNFGANQDFLIAAKLLTTAQEANPTAGLDYRLIVDKRLNPGSTQALGYVFYLLDGKLSLQLGNGTSIASYETNINVANGLWNDVLVKIDRDNAQGIQFFLNGQLQATANPTAFQNTNLTNTANLTIGQRSDGVTGPAFVGSFDSVCVAGGLDQSVCNVNLTSYGQKPSTYDPKLFTVEGRIGGTGGTAYEYAVGPDGAQTSNTGIIYQDWVNGQPVNWTLNWDPVANKATFQLTTSNNTPIGSPISYTFTGSNGSNDKFNGLCLLAKSYLDTKVAAGTISQVNVTSMTIQKTNNKLFTTNNPLITPDGSNPGPTTLSRTATSGSNLQLDQACYGFNNVNYQEFTQLRGTAIMSWTSGNPVASIGQSAVTFQIKGYDPPTGEEVAAADDPQSVPEPKSITGLLALGILGTVSILRRKP